MKNTIKREYERTVLEDGSIDLSFDAPRYLDNATNYLMIILVMAGFGLILGTFIPKINSAGGLLFLWVVAFGAFVYAIRSILRHIQVIKIHPGKGIEFRGESIPFSDIDVVGVLSPKGATNGISWLILETNGKQVKIAAVKNSLASALKSEIMSSSETKWDNSYT